MLHSAQYLQQLDKERKKELKDCEPGIYFVGQETEPLRPYVIRSRAGAMFTVISVILVLVWFLMLEFSKSPNATLIVFGFFFFVSALISRFTANGFEYCFLSDHVTFATASYDPPDIFCDAENVPVFFNRAHILKSYPRGSLHGVKSYPGTNYCTIIIERTGCRKKSEEKLWLYILRNMGKILVLRVNKQDAAKALMLVQCYISEAR